MSKSYFDNKKKKTCKLHFCGHKYSGFLLGLLLLFFPRWRHREMLIHIIQMEWNLSPPRPLKGPPSQVCCSICEKTNNLDFLKRESCWFLDGIIRRGKEFCCDAEKERAAIHVGVCQRGCLLGDLWAFHQAALL